MADLNGFDANQIEPTGDFELIPAAKYLAVITASEMKPTKAGTGHYLELAFQIQEGDYENRLLWARLNLDNPNATAVQIAQADLSAICRAIGVMKPNDSVELHNLPLVISVKCKKREDTGELTNEIKGYFKKESPAPAADAPAADNTSVEADLIQRLDPVVREDRTHRRDVDNVQKALLDALEHGGAYEDDSQIVRLSIEKGEPIGGGKTIVQIRKA